MKVRSLSPFWLLVILTGLNLFNYLDRYVVNQVAEDIRGEFGLTDGQAGRINTAFMIGYFFTAPLFGYLGDRMSRKWLIAAGIFVWSLGTVLSGFASGFISLLTFRILVGLGEASYATISPSLISDSYGPKQPVMPVETKISAQIRIVELNPSPLPSPTVYKGCGRRMHRGRPLTMGNAA